MLTRRILLLSGAIACLIWVGNALAQSETPLDWTINYVPEPASVILLSLGAALIFARRPKN